MIDDLLKFHFTENTIDSLNFKDSNFISKLAFIIILSNFTITGIIYFMFINKLQFNPFGIFIVTIFCFLVFFSISLYIFNKKIKKIHKSFLKNNTNFLGTYCATFQEYKIYNLLYKIGQDALFRDDEDFFKDLNDKCTCIISSLTHIDTISSKNIIFYTSIVSLFTTCFSDAFSELFKERDLGLLLSFVSVTVVIIWFVLATMWTIKNFELDLHSKIYKYKSLQTHLKSAEMLHKKMRIIHGDYYLSKSIQSKKDLENIKCFFNDNNFTSTDIQCIKSYINDLILTNKSK